VSNPTIAIAADCAYHKYTQNGCAVRQHALQCPDCSWGTLVPIPHGYCPWRQATAIDSFAPYGYT